MGDFVQPCKKYTSFNKKDILRYNIYFHLEKDSAVYQKVLLNISLFKMISVQMLQPP